MECHRHYVISMELQCNYMGSRWNAMEFHVIQKIGTLTKLMSGCSGNTWNLANKMAANNKFKNSFKYLGGIIFHGLEYLIRHEVVFCFIFWLN